MIGKILITKTSSTIDDDSRSNVTPHALQQYMSLSFSIHSMNNLDMTALLSNWLHLALFASWKESTEAIHVLSNNWNFHFKSSKTSCTVLYCTVNCTVNCTVLYCTELNCTVLYCELYCTVLYCTELNCTVLYCTVLNCTVLYWTVLYCTELYCTELNCTVLYWTVLWTVLYCTELYWTELYCTVLPYSLWKGFADCAALGYLCNCAIVIGRSKAKCRRIRFLLCCLRLLYWNMRR